MARRYVYEATGRPPYVSPVEVEFEWFAGFSLAQKRRCIASLHGAYLAARPEMRVLEISSKGADPLGPALSAFSLELVADGRRVPVECAFQAGKVFEGGGPYADLLDASPRDAKRDSRLRESGAVVGFSLLGEEFAAEPKDAYYRWLYFKGLEANPGLAERLLDYDAFTDIEFNPKKQVNCQAVAAASYVSLAREGKLGGVTESRESFLMTVYGIGA